MHVSTPTKELKLWQTKKGPNICLGCAKNRVFFSAVSCKNAQFLVHPKQIFGPSYFAYTAVHCARWFTSNIDHVTFSFSICLFGYCHRSLHASNWFAREIIGCPFTLLQRGQVVNQLGSPHITLYVLDSTGTRQTRSDTLRTEFKAVTQSICTKYFSFKNLGRFVNLKKIGSKTWGTKNRVQK